MTWLDNPVIQQKLPEAVGETLKMVGWSTTLTVAVGLPLGIALVTTARGGLAPFAPVHRVLGLVVNVGRSVPFLILMISIIPFTRWVVGTSLGWEAAVVPLTVGAIPFYARLAEAALREVGPEKVDAARVMGSSRPKIVRAVLVREALPGLVAAATVTAIALVSYSAMAGVIGAGGLGALAHNYGYSRFQGDVMVITVAVIVVIVTAIQVVGDVVVRWLDHRTSPS